MVAAWGGRDWRPIYDTRWPYGQTAKPTQELSFPIDGRRRIVRRRPRPLIQLLRGHSDVGLLRVLDGVVDLDAEIANGAGYARMSK